MCLVCLLEKHYTKTHCSREVYLLWWTSLLTDCKSDKNIGNAPCFVIGKTLHKNPVGPSSLPVMVVVFAEKLQTRPSFVTRWFGADTKHLTSGTHTKEESLPKFFDRIVIFDYQNICSGSNCLF